VRRDLDRLVGDYGVVFHLAGRAHTLSDGGGNENLYQAANVEGTRHVLEVAERRRARAVVFLSSVKAMGEESTGCRDELTESMPTTPYGRSKLAAERLVFDYGKRTGTHVTCLRLPLVYGSGNKGNLFSMISAIDRGWFPPVPEVRNLRSMIHVSDVVEAALLVSSRPEANGQGYIVTDGRPYSTREIYDLTCRALGKRVPRWSVPLALLKAAAYGGDAIGRVRGRRFTFDSDALEKLTGSAWYSSEKISRELGYRPKITFEDALPEMIAWYRKTNA
jgi:nucleoside-diphosphate-sugar epimerase